MIILLFGLPHRCGKPNNKMIITFPPKSNQTSKIFDNSSTIVFNNGGGIFHGSYYPRSLNITGSSCAVDAYVPFVHPDITINLSGGATFGVFTNLTVGTISATVSGFPN